MDYDTWKTTDLDDRPSRAIDDDAGDRQADIVLAALKKTITDNTWKGLT